MTYDPYAQPEDSQEPEAASSPSYEPAPDQADSASYAPGPAFEPAAQPAPQPAYPPVPQPQPAYPQPYAPQPGPAQPYAQPAPYAQPGPYPQPGQVPPPPYIQPGYPAYPMAQTPPYSTYPSPFIHNDPNSPGAPLIGASPIEAYKRFWLKSLTYKGRASRSEYWWPALFNSVIGFCLLFATAASSSASGDPHPIPTLLALFFGLALILPSIAINTRRLHDQNQSGWMQLIGMIPYVGGFIMLVLMAQPSRPEGARYDY